MLKRRGQSPIEYTFLVIIVIGALLTFGNYFKRGIQGRWKAVVDDIGDQYDPRVADSNSFFSMQVNSQTRITTVPTINGLITFRTDFSNAIESRTANVEVGSYISSRP